MIKPVLIYPRMALKTKCFDPVDTKARIEYLRNLKGQIELVLKDMWDTMDAISFGVGLSSNQIDYPDLAMCVIDPTKNVEKCAELPEGQRKPFYMIFPEINYKSEPKQLNEGCLSLPGYYADLNRSDEVDVTYMTLESIETEHPYLNLPDAKGFLAQIIQHEVDHLNGICFIDHIGPMKRDMAMKKMAKTRKKIQDFQWTPGGK